MPAAYRVELDHLLREFVTGGRGDDARGRHLASLYALEGAFALGAFDYRPTRDVAAWTMLLIDIVGERLALAPADRLDMRVAEFLGRVGELGLRRTALITEEALLATLARATGLDSSLARPLLGRLRVAALLWTLGYRGHGSNGERHPQARHIRKLVRARVDAAWEGQVRAREGRRIVDALDVLAALPISFGQASKAVQAALRRVDEDLAHVPFAVFYALVTDARRAGRVWLPPARYVEGGCYTRATFDAAVGHVFDGSRSRRRRFGRSVALSDLGLSAVYPATIARLDVWLARYDLPELCIAAAEDTEGPAWYPWAVSNLDEIERRHHRLLDAVRNRWSDTRPHERSAMTQRDGHRAHT